MKNADWFAPGSVVFDHGHLMHDPVKICMICFLVQGEGHNIMIDTGMDGIDQTYTEQDKKEWDHLGPSKDTHELLAEKGLACDDIDTILFTHLHFDHYWNVEQFRNAKMVANRKDWFFAMDPYNLPVFSPKGFPRQPLAYMAGEAFERLTLIDDYYEPFPGIQMQWVGGHSPGHMVIRVETGEGPVIIVGDAIYLYANLERNIPIGYYTHFKELIDAMNWLREQDAIILPAHDYEVFKRFPSLTIGA
jgi:glyoxylase-like metal-dependent hydrolase (beta-lactamase superfamily II)